MGHTSGSGEAGERARQGPLDRITGYVAGTGAALLVLGSISYASGWFAAHGASRAEPSNPRQR